MFFKFQFVFTLELKRTGTMNHFTATLDLANTTPPMSVWLAGIAFSLGRAACTRIRPRKVPKKKNYFELHTKYWNKLKQQVFREKSQLRVEGHFGFHTFSTKFGNLLKYGMDLKFETIVHIFKQIIQPHAVNILRSSNKYYRKLSKN